jgi:beta-N-acetylhexosaminidase
LLKKVANKQTSGMSTTKFLTPSSVPSITRQKHPHGKRVSSVVFRLLILILLASNPFFFTYTGAKAQTISSKDRAQALLDSLTPEERVGQLFLVTFDGTDAGPDSQIYDLITKYHIGGVILDSGNDNFAQNPQTLSDALKLTRQLQNDEWSGSQTNQVDPVSNLEFTPAFIPLFIGLSQEGDGAPYDQIINGLTPLPSEMALGATWDPDLARSVGDVLGNELSALGINLLLGPSLDVLETPHPQGTGDLGVRTFGGDPYWVGEMGKAYITGVHEGSDGNIAVVAKHFPGHGSSDRLPEEEVATVRKSLEQLKQIELPPFFAVTGNAPTPEATVDGLLASHIRYQGFQGNIRETTRPVSLDRQAFDQLMALPAFANWRDKGGVMISDDLGSRAFRVFEDPTGNNFNAIIIARDAFLTGNDLLYLGKGFVGSSYPDYFSTLQHTLDLFTQKYRNDQTFRTRVDDSVLRILTLKYNLYKGIFTPSLVLVNASNLANIATPDHLNVTFEVAQKAATLISPSMADLADTLPEPPGLNDRIVFITDERMVKQCSECPEQPVMAVNALEQDVIRLYGLPASGQVLPRNLYSYSFADLQNLLDNNDQIDTTAISDNLQHANWIVFCLLNPTTNIPTSQVLTRFLAERPDLFRQKKLVVFAFNAPYFLDATEVSKITVYYGLYSKAAPFIEIAARLLFGELPAPPGDLPVSVPGVSYDLISETAPDPNQTIQLYLDFPDSNPTEQGTPTPEPTRVPEFQVGDLIPVRTDVIKDHNGHPIPDDTPVQFILKTIKAGSNTPTQITQVEKSRSGIARTTFLINSPGILDITVESDPAKQSTTLSFEIVSQGIEASPPTETPTPTATPTLEPTPTNTEVPIITPQPPTRASLSLGDWFMAVVVTSLIGGLIFWFELLSQLSRWGIRGGFLALIGGLLAYTYLALGMPGSNDLLVNAGHWGVLLVTIFGSIAGWAVAWSWQKIRTSA